jgi:hypothetical protein
MPAKLAFPIVFLCLLVAAVVGSADSTAPLPVSGTYFSADLGGGVCTGRISESWASAPAGYGRLGNAIIATSVSGPSMGTQWELWCASITAQPMFVSDVRDSTESGEVVWTTSYTGGQFWLSGTGPWANPGSTDFTGSIDVMFATTTYLYTNGALTGVVSQTSISGDFDPADWSGWRIECTFNDVTFIGSTDLGPKPGEYPAFMASDCGPWMAGTGAWGNVANIEIRIYDGALTPVKEATWGEIKAMYNN